MKFVLPLALAAALAASEEKKPEQVRATVHLKDGSAVQGTVRRMRLGKSITLGLSSGKSITLEDADIVSIEIYGSAAAPDAGAPPAEAPAAKGQVNPPSFAPLPKATPPGELDTVFLNDGGILRGTLESERPDVVLKLVSGRKRTIAARDVKSILKKGAAPADPNDAVFLKDGGVLRGAIESEKPEVVIKLLSGKKRTVPPANVQRIERARKP